MTLLRTSNESTYIYLHGFASSPSSAKAAFFRERFRQWGVRLIAPDLNVPTFEDMTVTGMVERLQNVISVRPQGPVYIIASSLGALVALHVAAQNGRATGRPIAKLILLAPSLKFLDHRQQDLGSAGMESWRLRGKWPFFHAHSQRERELGYQFVEDLSQYSSVAPLTSTPTLIYHGILDEHVSIDEVAALVAANPAVRLRQLASDHRLMDSLHQIWAGTVQFFNLCGTYAARTPVTIERHHVSAGGSNAIAGREWDKCVQILVSAYESRSLSADEHTARLTSVDHTVLLAASTTTANVVAVSYIRHDGKRGATAVLPSLQRRGIGRQLVCASLPLFARQYTEVGLDHDHMKRLLLSSGFVPVIEESTLLSRLGPNASRVATVELINNELRYTRDSSVRPGMLREYVMLQYERESV